MPGGKLSHICPVTCLWVTSCWSLCPCCVPAGVTATPAQPPPGSEHPQGWSLLCLSQVQFQRGLILQEYPCKSTRMRGQPQPTLPQEPETRPGDLEMLQGWTMCPRATFVPSMVPLYMQYPCLYCMFWAAIPGPPYNVLAGRDCPCPQGSAGTGGRAGEQHCPSPASAHPPYDTAWPWGWLQRTTAP